MNNSINETKMDDLSHKLAKLRSQDKHATPPITDIPIIDEKIKVGKSLKLVTKS